MSRRTIIFVLALLVPAVVGVINIYQWLTPEKAEICVFYKWEHGSYHLPWQTRDFLRLCQDLKALIPKNSKISPEQLQRLQTLFSQQPKIFSDQTNESLLDEILPVFDPSGDSPPLYTKWVLQIRAVNLGSVAASDVVLMVGQAGYFEVWPAGEPDNPEQKGRTTGEIRLGRLNPDEDKWVTYWPADYDDTIPVKASHGDGRSSVVEQSVERTGDNFVLSFTKIQLVIAVTSTVIIAIAAVFLSLSRRKAKRTLPQTPTGTT